MSSKNQNLPRWKRSFPSGLKDPIRKRPHTIAFGELRGRSASNGAGLFDSALVKSMN